MKGIVHHLKQHQIDHAYSIKPLEQALIKEGCMILHEFDKKHLSWRQRLNKGERFIETGQPLYFLNDNHEEIRFVLGDEVKGNIKQDDLYKVYEIHQPDTLEKHDHYLMVVGPNRICHELNHMMRTESFWGLETPAIQFIHPKGKYAIIEKLPHAIDSLEWKSLHAGELREEDRQYAEPMQKLIKFFIEQKNTPKDFVSDYLKFDSLGSLKSIKGCVPGGHVDYIALEELAFKVAQGKYLPVYQHIIKPLREDKICKNKIIPFFKEVLESVFSIHPLSIEQFAKKRCIQDQAIIKRAYNLQHFAKKIKDTCLQSIHNQYSHINKENICIVIKKHLLEFYDKGKTLGRFWDTFRIEDLIESIEKELHKNVLKSIQRLKATKI